MKKSLVILTITFTFLCVFFYSEYLYAGQTDPGEGSSATGTTAPYHLVKSDPAIYRATIYKIYIVRDDSTEVTLYEESSGNTVDMTIDEFTSVESSASVPAGDYTQAKIITTRTFGLRGYAYYDVSGGTRYYYYTKDGTSQSDIGSLQSSSWTEQSDYGTQTATMEDPGEGTEETTYNGNDAFLYTNTIDLTIDEDTSGTLRVKFQVNNALELNDTTINVADHTASSPATNAQVYSITFSAPELEVELLDVD